MKNLKWILLAILVLLILAFFLLAGKFVDRKMNVHLTTAHPEPSSELLDFHKSLQIADWHADNLLWDRNPLKELNHGHIDIPRLLKGNVTLQVFDAVIKTPRGINYESNTDQTDNITLLAMANRWPIKTWSSLYERAIYQSDKLHKAAKRSEGKLVIIRSQSDLTTLLERNIGNGIKQLGGVLSIEGLHALEGDLNKLELLYKAGYRMMGLTHFFDNEVGGSSAGIKQGGLTPFGRKVIRKMNDLGIIIDLAHASKALIEDVQELSTLPCVVSHTGVQGTYESPRNLSDYQLREITSRCGIIGIGFWDGAVGDSDPVHIARAMRHTINVVGIDHVSLGSDWDGSTQVHFDAEHLWVLTQTLLDEDFTHEEIEKIMGKNQIQFLLNYLPKE